MPTELMLSQKLIMPTEQSMVSSIVLPWKEEMTREDLIHLRIRQLEKRIEDVELTVEHLKQSRLQTKTRFDKVNWLSP